MGRQLACVCECGFGKGSSCRHRPKVANGQCAGRFTSKQSMLRIRRPHHASRIMKAVTKYSRHARHVDLSSPLPVLNYRGTMWLSSKVSEAPGLRMAISFSVEVKHAMRRCDQRYAFGNRPAMPLHARKLSRIQLLLERRLYKVWNQTHQPQLVATTWRA